MAEYAQRGQCAVAVPGCHLSGAPSVLRGFAGVGLGARLPALFPGGGRRRRLGVVGWRQRGGRASAAAAVGALGGGLCCLLCRRRRRCLRVAVLVPTGTVVSSLERAVKVDADPVAGDP